MVAFPFVFIPIGMLLRKICLVYYGLNIEMHLLQRLMLVISLTLVIWAYALRYIAIQCNAWTQTIRYCIEIHFLTYTKYYLPRRSLVSFERLYGDFFVKMIAYVKKEAKYWKSSFYIISTSVRKSDSSWRIFGDKRLWMNKL